MLDRTEQAKGGFRAQVARAEELRTQHAHRASAGEAGTASTDVPHDLPHDAASAAESQADGECGPAPRQPLKPALPTSPARPPKRWH